MNKVINGKQFTIAWHFDDLKISNVEVNVVNDIINRIDQEYGQQVPLTKSQGKVHDYLGMMLDCRTPSEVVISMENYVNGYLRYHAI